MIIDDKKWSDIIAATKAEIDWWNASAAKNAVKDAFRFSTRKSETYDIILTEHDKSYGRDVKALARDSKTGDVRRAKVVRKNGRITGFSVLTSDPKAWKSLADKPADEIVRKVGLTNFSMWFTNSGVSEPTKSTMVYRGYFIEGESEGYVVKKDGVVHVATSAESAMAWVDEQNQRAEISEI